jgi:hypothetical protein
MILSSKSFNTQRLAVSNTSALLLKKIPFIVLQHLSGCDYQSLALDASSEPYYY